DWQTGGFRFSEPFRKGDGTSKGPMTGPGPFAEPSLKGEAGQMLTLTAGLDAGATPRRPSGRIKTAGADYSARQLTWWQVGEEQPALSAYISYELLRGRLFQLPVLLPSGWEVERVELLPRDTLRNWTILSDKGRQILLVDLVRGLAPGPAASPQLRVWLKGPKGQGARSRVPLAFPDVVPWSLRPQEGAPLGPRVHEGVLAISVSSNYQATPRETSAPAGPPPRPSQGPEKRSALPWGELVPDLYYTYRRQAPDG